MKNEETLRKSRKKQTPDSIKPLDSMIGLDELRRLSRDSATVVQEVRASMLAPESRKKPPVFTSAKMADLCGVDMARVQYLSKKGELPSGAQGGTRLELTLVEARQLVRALRPELLRNPALSSGVVITVANFKGGVSKTTTAAALAQGLSLRGHKVLVVDTDPQGSLTTLFGYLPDTDVNEEHTILPLISGDSDSILPAIRPTYWDGIDLVAAAPILFNAEFLLPSRQMRDQNFQFWRVLDQGLDAARELYDIIIIDTPPSLSYITTNALIAAQGIVMPLPPNALDFASSAQFWKLFTDVMEGFFESRGESKKYAFIDVLLSRVDRADVVSNAVREWIVTAYGAKVLPIEIPKTSIAATASAEFGTVYDMDPSSTQAKTLKRARDAYDQLCNHVAFQVAGIWAADARDTKLRTQK